MSSSNFSPDIGIWTPKPRKVIHRPSKEEILSTNIITPELLYNWFVEDTNGMNRLHMPLTKVRQINKIIMENHKLRE